MLKVLEHVLAIPIRVCWDVTEDHHTQDVVGQEVDCALFVTQLVGIGGAPWAGNGDLLRVLSQNPLRVVWFGRDDFFDENFAVVLDNLDVML